MERLQVLAPLDVTAIHYSTTLHHACEEARVCASVSLRCEVRVVHFCQVQVQQVLAREAALTLRAGEVVLSKGVSVEIR